MNTTVTDIARHHLGIEALETRKSDRLDFHDLAVWQIREALEAAYRAGQQQGRANGVALPCDEPAR